MFMFKDSLVMELNYVDTEFSGVFFQYAIEVLLPAIHQIDRRTAFDPDCPRNRIGTQSGQINVP